MDKYLFNGEEFEAVLQTKNWTIGLLRYSERFSKLGCFERHLLTDEAFILLSGNATLYVKNGDEVTETVMEQNIVYNIPKAEWHHIVVDKDARFVLVSSMF